MNRAAANSAQKRWREKNPQKCVEKGRKFRAANPEKARAWSKKWSAANPEKILSARLRRDFGISLEDYQTMLAKQGGVCAVCLKPEKTKRRLAVDHDHNTGKIRGLLCRDCNTSLGKLGDSPEILRRAAAYLENNFPACRRD